MKKKDEFIELKSSGVYYYSNIIQNILSGNPDTVGFISHFKEIQCIQLFRAFKRKTAFHYFCEYIIMIFFENDMFEKDQIIFQAHNEHPPLKTLYAEKFLTEYDLEYPFLSQQNEKQQVTWKAIEDYYEELHLSGYLSELYEKMGNEVVHILFSNRKILLQFNWWMSSLVQDGKMNFQDDELYSVLYKKKGYLKRKKIPEWVKRSVFMRDKGYCSLCRIDLRPSLRTTIEPNYDHIVPLNVGGLNDITNIQLLCKGCNNAKGGNKIETSDWYDKWF